MTMRTIRFRFLASWVVLFAGVLADPVAAQAPPPKPKPKPYAGGASKSTSPVPAKASLLVQADDACTLRLDGKVVKRLAQGESAVLPVSTFGDHLLEAEGADGVIWSEVVTIEEAKQVFVSTGLWRRREEVAALIALAEQARLSETAERDPERLSPEPLQVGLLMWTRQDNGSNLDWHRATAYCDSLSLAGYEDWRLPTIEELESLHSTSPAFEGDWNVVPGILLSHPWVASSSRIVDSPEPSAWYFDFLRGERLPFPLDEGDALRALCVRSDG